jgi:uncharacterized SAM-binding protein YcdF (DUF218 family)
VLAKILAALLLPLDLSLALLALGLLLRLAGRRRAALSAAASGGALLWLASTPAVSGALVRRMEGKSPPVAVADSPQADVIVVLGGAVASKLPPRLTTELADASDRVLHAARLYRAGKAPVVLVSGGRLEWSAASVPESQEIAALLVEWGVPKAAIVEERDSATTRQNAVGTARILAERRLRKVLLVTSALHMPRALAAFRRAGVDAIPTPTDFTAVEAGFTPFSLLPDAGALQGTTAAVHEEIGLAYYGLRGWI